jgi:hypothetical protein
VTNVTVTWDRERKVRLLTRGDEQSEIQWLDDRTTQILPNSQIEFTKADHADQ